MEGCGFAWSVLYELGWFFIMFWVNTASLESTSGAILTSDGGGSFPTLKTRSFEMRK